MAGTRTILLVEDEIIIAMNEMGAAQERGVPGCACEQRRKST